MESSIQAIIRQGLGERFEQEFEQVFRLGSDEGLGRVKLTLLLAHS